jgi:hypothetical protein
MVTLQIKIDCDNAAFEPDYKVEVAAILHRIAFNLEELAQGYGDQDFTKAQTILDSNGNDVGRIKLHKEGV